MCLCRDCPLKFIAFYNVCRIWFQFHIYKPHPKIKWKSMYLRCNDTVMYHVLYASTRGRASIDCNQKPERYQFEYFGQCVQKLFQTSTIDILLLYNKITEYCLRFLSMRKRSEREETHRLLCKHMMTSEITLNISTFTFTYPHY